MGVPALFRWLSKKYPKIVNKVAEETPTKVRNQDGEIVEVPVRYESKNPNGFEVDNLYLDMNGIVHPCTHPEGKPAPETEEEMMAEVFKYTERVVNMARPRKVLMMAIDGVAPRAKMNQQRSRRFRAAQEAADKEEERRESIKLFEAMGHPVSDEAMNKKSWDTNAITPGTPFMDLLSKSLKYWISWKLTNDPGWKDVKVILSDSSVPGEGEHKIVDWIRRQRTDPGWDANTSHVIYGLDADLIMLALATHEPNFRVLREDVFAQGSTGPRVCKKCGVEGHVVANCKGQAPPKDPNVVEKAKPVDPKPFIFLDVSVLREYLAVELRVPTVPFPFDQELAIDDWIFMIFFVGNDFLPHLPSLEIREGAIDALLKIWKTELPRMGGYLTNHGKVDLARAQVILEGLAKNEDSIFQKRREDEERQDSRQKRQRIDEHARQDAAQLRKDAQDGAGMQLNGHEYVAVDPSKTARGGNLHPSLPTRPAFDIVPKEEVAEKKLNPAQKREKEAENMKRGVANMDAESSVDVVRNRRAIRMANMSAADRLRAEMNGETVDGEDEGDDTVKLENKDEEEKEELDPEQAKAALEAEAEDEGADGEVVEPALATDEDEGEAAVPLDGQQTLDESEEKPHGHKRKVEEVEAEDEEDDLIVGDDGLDAPPDIESDQPASKKKLKFNADGTVDGYEDDVRLWEPGYRERYYERKFGTTLADRSTIDKITMHYMEGLCWVLEYYYQGVPAWDWYYPYHYAPFAQDFQDVGSLNIQFKDSAPFTPYGQLLGVFPAASRIHLPMPLQGLMTEDDSPIIDFYPDDFEIDMNGKKMVWQGVALLPFIDEKRLLKALKSKEPELTDDEKRRNRWGDNVMFIGDHNALYEPFCGLYTLKPVTKPVLIDTQLSLGTSGSVLADPNCVPYSGLESPLPNIEECPDIPTNNSLSVRYYFPRQAHPHHSVILPGYKPIPAQLSEGDKDWVRRGGGPGGGRGGRGGGGGGPRYSGGPGMGNHAPRPPRNGGGDYGSYGARSGPPPPAPYGSYAPPPQAAYGGAGGYGNPGLPPNPYARGAPPPPNPYAGNAYGAPSAAYGGYAPPPPPTLPRNGNGAYGAPPPNPYPPPRNGGGYGGSNGGGGGYGGYGGGGGGYGGGGGGRR